MVRPEGFEPPTLWFVARYSIQLSYGRVMWNFKVNLHKRKAIFNGGERKE